MVKPIRLTNANDDSDSDDDNSLEDDLDDDVRDIRDVIWDEEADAGARTSISIRKADDLATLHLASAFLVLCR